MSIKIERWNWSGEPDEAELQLRMEAEGYQVFRWQDQPGTVYWIHEHTEDQSHWIVSGVLELTVNREKYILRAGDRDFMPAHIKHSAFVPGAEPVVYLIGVKN